MTRDDWTLISVRALGLYLVGINLGPFIVAISTLIIVLTQNPNAHPMPITTWQSPIVATIGLLIGVIFVTKSRAIATSLQNADKKK